MLQRQHLTEFTAAALELVLVLLALVRLLSLADQLQMAGPLTQHLLRPGCHASSQLLLHSVGSTAALGLLRFVDFVRFSQACLLWLARRSGSRRALDAALSHGDDQWKVTTRTRCTLQSCNVAGAGMGIPL